ncbi:MAG TPA: exodeoxyribonuclease VII large subunit, partial [Gemmatimonadaceae bacterium]|nr:exodeoxyribonuclease VII large subunit [Gemmatimonadaceae bacterium]
VSPRRGPGRAPSAELALDLFASAAPPVPSAPPERPGPAMAEDGSTSPHGRERRRSRGRSASRPAIHPDPWLDGGLSPGFLEVPGSSAASAVAVSTVTATAKDLLEGAFLPLWVRGEVSDFKAHRNGHWYFCLRDHAAQIRCVVWSRDQRGIPAPPDDGMQVTALAQVTVYAARGDLQLSVKTMEAAGDGLWRKALEQARARLDADGLLDPERKRPLPRYPRCVAIVTSPSGAALHDIVAVARRRWGSVQLLVVPAKVQGDGAVHELCAAIDRAGRCGLADVVIVGRGGGAREDLWAFNDEGVARAVAYCPVPTISAVGHEVDVTLCDLVADLRAPTPSAAAEAAVPVRAEADAAVRRLGARLAEAMTLRLEGAEAERRAVADALAARAGRYVERYSARLRELAGRLHALSPLATLARGYAVAQDGHGATLASVDAFTPGLEFALLLRDGRVQATTLSSTPSTPSAR